MPAAKKEKHDSENSKTEICNKKKVKEAVTALKLLNKKFIEGDLKKQPLLEDTAESPIYLQVMLKKIPPPQLIRMIKVALPHSLMTETSEVCLITGDLDKRDHKAEVEPTILHYKDLLKKHGVTKVNQVIPLRQLRTEYKTYESKRQLAAAYDVFLADKKIAGVIPKTLGKSFFQNRKFPIQIDMRRQNLKDQIDKALCQTEFSLTCRGNSYALEVARLSMEDDAIIKNLMASIEVLTNKLPGNEKNILSLYLKTAKSKAIPVYVSLDIPDDLLIKKPRKSEKYKLDELSTMDDAEVKVFRDGRVIVRKMKKDSAEKEVTENEQFSVQIESEEDTQESIDHKVSPKKKKKGKKAFDLIETTNSVEMENEEDTQDSAANKLSPKKKKGKTSIALEEVADISRVENEEIQYFAATEVSSTKKKKGKKSTGLDEIADVSLVENEEIQNSITTETFSKKKKKGKKSAGLDKFADISVVENEKIQDSITTEISSKKKKKGKKSTGLDEVANISLVKNEEDNQKISFKASKNKKNVNLSQVKADEVLEHMRESNVLLSSKKRKIRERDNFNEKAQKSKNKKVSKSENNDEIEKNKMISKINKNISEVVKEIKLQTPLKSKKEKKTIICIEDVETPLRSKKGKKESTNSVTKRKLSNVDSDVKNSLELNKRRKSGRKSIM